MKEYIYLTVILIFFGLFIASPYILDYFQMKGALEATGGLSCTEGFVNPMVAKCVTVEGACAGAGICSLATASVCPESNLTGTSAGGQTCGANYLLNVTQAPIVQGSKNVIIGGTTMTTLSVVASEKGCVGCTAMINDSKVYLVKNKILAFYDYIIAGIKDQVK